MPEVHTALANSTADIAISGIDLLQNSDLEVQKKIKIYKRLNYAHATFGIFCLIFGLIARLCWMFRK